MRYTTPSYTTRFRIVGLLPALLLLLLLAAACGSPSMGGMDDQSTAIMDDSMEGMDHGAMGESDAPFDAQFIDSMIEHHRGAVTMAEQALAESERAEVRALAEAIIAAQQQEIAQMAAWREVWYPDLPASEGMGMDMGTMMLSEDTSLPIDQRFLTGMISHHNGAVAMARQAQNEAEHEELRQLAGAIITAQEAEIEMMQGWLQEWFAVE